jgi:hypothetical protein
LLALFLASPTAALRPNTPFHPDPCHGQQIKAPAFHDFAESVWELSRWEREKPRPGTIASKRHKLDCAAGPGHRKAMVRSWALFRAGFYAHRRDELWRVRITPYPGGGRWWPIPYYIVACESGGDYGAQNPTSSARGAFQLLDTTHATYCTICDWSKRDQDLTAHRLYQEQGAGPWVCG